MVKRVVPMIRKEKAKAVDKKGGGKGKATKVARVIAAAAADKEGEFPKKACGLDSWANVWLKHEDTSS